MKSLIIFIFLFCLLASCISTQKSNNLIYKNINDNDIVILDTISLFDKTYSMKKVIKIYFNNIEYYVSVNYKNEIDFAVTWDKRFITPDSVKVGDTFKKVKEISTLKSFYSDNFVYVLNSGWSAILKFDHKYIQDYPDDSSRVFWLERSMYP